MSWNDLRKGRSCQTFGEYFITFNTNKRQPFFADFYLSQIFCQQIKDIEHRHGCFWFAWVLMPDHFHGLLRLDSDAADLSQVVGDLKGRSAFFINQHAGRKGTVWQPAFYDRALRREDDRLAIARYIVANPLRKRLVENIGNYPFWDTEYLLQN